MNKSLIAGLAGIAMFAVTANANAFQIFTDRTAWENAVAASPLGGSIVDDPFDNDIAEADSISFDSGVISTGAPASASVDNRVLAGQYAGRVRGNLSDTDVFDTLTWDFPMAIFAFAADWTSTASGSGLTVTGDFDGTGGATISFNAELVGFPGSGFLGLVGDAAFSTITFGSEVPDDGAEFFQADNLSFAKVAAVPEPAGIALFGLGLAGLALYRQRARQ